jgi:mRNA interferase MazF
METLKPEEFILDSNDSEFLGTGLKVASKIKVARIATLERRLITKRLGQLGTNQTQQLNTILKQVFQLN